MPAYFVKITIENDRDPLDVREASDYVQAPTSINVLQPFIALMREMPTPRPEDTEQVPSTAEGAGENWDYLD